MLPTPALGGVAERYVCLNQVDFRKRKKIKKIKIRISASLFSWLDCLVGLCRSACREYWKQQRWTMILPAPGGCSLARWDWSIIWCIVQWCFFLSDYPSGSCYDCYHWVKLSGLVSIVDVDDASLRLRSSSPRGESVIGDVTLLASFFSLLNAFFFFFVYFVIR